MMVDQEDFAAEFHVAVWLGDHASEDELDEYLEDGTFSDDYRFELDDEMAPEFGVEPSPTPLRALVNGFSCHEQFEEEFLARAAGLGITEASSILVFHFMAYSPEGLPVSKQPGMRFIGNFRFQGFE